MDTVLVTGAAGFIGRYVVAELARRGYRVRATDLSGDLSHASELGCENAIGNLMHYRFCAEAVEGAEAVVHLAAAFDLGLPRDVLVDTNVGTTRNLTVAAASAGVSMFVQYSTCDVYGLVRRGPAGEEHPKRPANAYALSKLLSELTAESAMRHRGLAVAVIRPTFVYGPGAIYTAQSFIAAPAMLSRHASSIPLPRGGPRTNTVHVEDLVGATVAVLESGGSAVGGAFNVADDSAMDAREFLETTMEPFGVGCSRELGLPWLAIEAAARIGMHVPRALFTALNGLWGRAWDRIVTEYDLVPGITPRFDRDLLSFLFGEHLYDNGRMKSLGWSPRYRTFADGWPGTVAEYRRRGLIP